MHTTKSEEGCKVSETKDNALDEHEPSSPFLTYPESPKEQTSAAAPVSYPESPKEQTSAAAPVSHRPPMTVVVISGSSESCTMTASNEDAQRKWSFSSPHAIVSMGSMDESKNSWQRSHAESVNESLGTAPSPFSSFKLKPRSLFPLNSPSQRGRGMGGARGRKRPAHSISIPAGSVSSADSPSRPPRPSESSSPGSEITRNDASLSPDCLNIKSLSLRSPRATFESTRCSTIGLGSQQSANRLSTHSFSMYAPSPAGSVVRDANTTTTSSSSSFMAARTPCSSTKSSPRLVPLTVLSHGEMRTYSSKNPMVRPPFHEGGSSLLFSLHNDCDSEDELLGRPRKEMASASPNSSLSSEETDRKTSTLLSPGMRPTPMMYSSPSKMAASSPKTQLPRIMLTPRTPQSSGSRKAGLPMFPSPSDDGIDALTLPQAHASIDDAIDNLLNGFKGEHGRFHSSTGYMQPLLEPTKNPGMRCYHYDSSNSLAFSADGSKCEAKDVDQFKQDESWMSFRPGAESDNGDRPTVPKAWEPSTPDHDVSAPILQGGVTEKATPPIFSFQETGHTTIATAHSLMSTSRHDGLVREMLTAARASDAETGSLSDSDDEDAFVLTCPCSEKPSSDACDGNRQAKKRRDSYENDFFEQRRGSYNSLTSRRGSYNSLTSPLASASSLLGMDFYQEEVTSLSFKNKTPGSSGALSTKDNGESIGLKRSVQSFGSIGLCLDGPASTNRPTIPFASLSIINKTSGSNGALSTKDSSDESFAPLGLQRSVHSFGSIGLCLDGPSASMDDNHGHDPVTPPVTRHVGFSPPPLAARPT